MKPVQFAALLAELDTHAQGEAFISLPTWHLLMRTASIPLSVKQEIISSIKAFLDKQFEP